MSYEDLSGTQALSIMKALEQQHLLYAAAAHEGLGAANHALLMHHSDLPAPDVPIQSQYNGHSVGTSGTRQDPDGTMQPGNIWSALLCKVADGSRPGLTSPLLDALAVAMRFHPHILQDPQVCSIHIHVRMYIRCDAYTVISKGCVLGC